MWRGGQDKSQLKSRLILEAIFQAELDQPRRNGSRLDFSKARGSYGAAGVLELRVVKCVEKFGTELKRRPFVQAADSRTFSQRQIKIGLMRSPE